MPSDAVAPRCGLCRFFEPDDYLTRKENEAGLSEGETYGRCRRHPPQFVGDSTAGADHDNAWCYWSFPVLSDQGLCGDFQPVSTPETDGKAFVVNFNPLDREGKVCDAE